MTGHTHRQVADVARELAHELYDKLMGDPELCALWRARWEGATEREREAKFVAMHWGKCVPMARATMALLLQSPMDEALKEKVSEALILDATLMRGKAKVVGTL
jgi:hypothetical protein